MQSNIIKKLETKTKKIFHACQRLKDRGDS